MNQAIAKEILVNCELKPFQLEGANWLLDGFYSNTNKLLADDMGCGKTIQVLALLAYLFNNQLIKSVLIVCPLSIVTQWSQETKEKTNLFSILSIYSTKSACDFVINQSSTIILTNFEALLKDELLKAFKFDYLVVDEAHRLKNSDSILYKKLLFEFQFEHKILLTGTPLMNNLNEFQNILHFLHPDRNLTAADDSILLRRKLSNLPPLKQVDVFVPLSKLQKQIYKSILLKYNTAFQIGSNPLVQLRKCVNHPYLFQGIEPYPFEVGEHLIEASGKLYVLDRLLSQLLKEGHKILIFSQMTSMLDILHDYLDYRSYCFERLDGSVRAEDRSESIQKFKSNESCCIFILSTRAFSLGLNLTISDTVIFYDSDFNPQIDSQAVARIHRIGQDKNCAVIRLVAQCTVEEVILSRSARKKILSESVVKSLIVSDGELKQSEMSPDDVSVACRYGLSTIEDESDLKQDEIINIVKGVLSMDLYSSLSVFSPNHEIDQKDLLIDSIYYYNGHDYTEERKQKDFEALERLITNEDPSIDTTLVKKRRLEEIQKIKLEKREDALKRRKEKLNELWARNNYISFRIPTKLSNEESKEAKCSSLVDVDENFQLIRGSINDQQNYRNWKFNYVLYTVDDSGEWYDKGIFKTIEQMSDGMMLSEMYKQTKEMKDLECGFSYRYDISNGQYQNKLMFVGLCCHKRGKKIQLTQLEKAIRDFSRNLLEGNGDECVHLPRFPTEDMNEWYVIERLLKKYISQERRVQVRLYYYRKRMTTR